jgi:P27 family predicted phage terminase small subunit
MPGPPPTPTHLRLIRGNPSKKAFRPEPQPTRTAQVPEPPGFLTGYAVDEWYSIAPELHRLGLLSVIDVMPLAAYCQAYKRWRMAEEILAEMAKRDLATSALLVKNTTGDAVQNPLVKIAAHAARDMIRFGGEFGMTPVARARIAAGVYAQSDAGKFDGLLG